MLSQSINSAVQFSSVELVRQMILDQSKNIITSESQKFKAQNSNFFLQLNQAKLKSKIVISIIVIAIVMSFFSRCLIV